MNRMAVLLIAIVTLAALPAAADRPDRNFSVEVLIDGRPLPQYVAYGTRYVEAVKGKEYAIRLHNALGVRVAVALSVDGLNTIDAGHTDARSARKWVLDPYQTITLSGWQTSMSQARRFYFTSEERSYAHWLGQTDNVGIISAVFFRELAPPPPPPQPILTPQEADKSGARDRRQSQSKAEPAGAPHHADEYAATGIGQRVDHRVQRIHMELEDHPVATVNIRYEYRPQLVRLGILPDYPRYPDPLARRQDAHGFCPEPR